MTEVTDLKIRGDDYWENRFTKQTKKMFNLGDGAIPEVNKLYGKTSTSIGDRVNKFYDKYGKIQNSPTFKTLADGTKVISGSSSKLVVPKNIAYGKLKDGTRLDKLIKDVNGDLMVMSKEQNKIMTNQLGLTATETYYDTFYEIHRGYGVGSSFNLLPQSTVNQLIHNPVNGQDFSKRVWNNRDALANRINQTLTDGINKGLSNREIAKSITSFAKVKPGSKKSQMRLGMDVANRLIRTEVTNTYNQAQRQAWQDVGFVKKYEYLATLDDRTSEICSAVDGKVFNVDDAVTGLNFPPMHVNCRSTTIASFENDKEGITRVARDMEGNTIIVPADMDSKKYKELYVNNVADVTPNKASIRLPGAEKSKPIVMPPKQVPKHVPKPEPATIPKVKTEAPLIVKKWVISDGRNVLTSFDTKKEATAYGMSRRKKGDAVFLYSKKDFNDWVKKVK